MVESLKKNRATCDGPVTWENVWMIECVVGGLFVVGDLILNGVLSFYSESFEKFLEVSDTELIDQFESVAGSLDFVVYVKSLVLSSDDFDPTITVNSGLDLVKKFDLVVEESG